MKPRRAPLVWILPPLAALLALVVFLERRSEESASSIPLAEDPDEEIAGFTGRLVLADQRELAVRLAPLHPDTERQAFDAQALRARLALEPGEPWRLSIARAAAPEPEQGPATELELARAIEVADAQGLALASFAGVTSTPGDPADPLRALLGWEGIRLEPGAEVALVLWGRAPGEGAHVRLWTGGAAIALAPSALRRADLEEPLARLDRPFHAGPPLAPGRSATDPASSAASEPAQR